MTDKVQAISENTKATATTRAVLLLTAIAAVLMLSSGVALAITKTCEANSDCFGTSDPDTLKGTDDGNDFIYGRGGADTIKGFGEEAALDYLHGQGGPDKIFGGSGPDALVGGAGDDELSGGVDFDYYYFGSGWGDDFISDGAASSNLVAFRGGPNANTPVVTEDLVVKLVSGDGPEVKTEGGGSTVEWEGNAINQVSGGSGDDRITGNLVANFVNAGPGADTVFGGGGDDYVRVNDGSSGDVVDCGEDVFGSDRDTVYFDAGDQIADNCENKVLAS
jgi:Ca2+-binding RTX toxin-like protein